MASLLTNVGAMTALQNLRSLNAKSTQVQTALSTGKAIATAKDNASIWSVSKTMTSDVQSFRAIASNLSMGESTVGVGRAAAESITEILTGIKGRITDAQQANKDRGKIQADIDAMVDQIDSIVNAAQFNGLNLIDGSLGGGAASYAKAGMDVLSSLDREGDGDVATSFIGVKGENLSLDRGLVLDDTAFGFSDVGREGYIDAGTQIRIDTISPQPLPVLPRDHPDTDVTATDRLIAGDLIELTVGGASVSYRVKEGDIVSSIGEQLASEMRASAELQAAGLRVAIYNPENIRIINETNEDVAFELTARRGTGALSELPDIDVTTDAGAKEALGKIDNMLDAAIQASANLGSAQSRIETQIEFVSRLIDSMSSGIGSLIDADMEEVSAKQQAVQVQQQLGMQALSVANRSPQFLTSLFQ